MSTDIVIPALGESITSGVIATWLKNDGDHVDRDETVLELETDKITLELPSPAAGVLKRKAAEGDTVEVGAVVGLIDESAAGASDKKDDAKKPEPEAKAAPEKEKAKESASKGSPAPAATKAESKPESKPEPEPAKAAATSSSAGASKGASGGSGGGGGGGSGGEDVRATPLARKIADERGVDLGRVAATGAGGRVREQDVLAFIQTHDDKAPTNNAAHAGSAPAGGPGAAFSRETSRERMSPLRQRIASRLVEAQQTAAMLTTFNECDMSAVMALRSRHKEQFEKTHGVGLGFMSFFVKACVSALRAFPLVNSQIVQGEQGPEVLRHEYCDIAVAVGTPKGLVVPVLRNCESLNFAQIEQGIKDLAAKARDGKLTLDDMQGGTFTISNGGVYGSMMSTPILNPPQSGILGMHNIVRRPVEHPDKPGSGEVAVRPMMYLALSYDHRIVDGAGAVGFLVHVRKCIENPERMLLDI
ncbi:MAG: 2-oxoglutarate dehydrogenase complex dihydrolipoyllysine-residue succinyltransferase [Phycisphaerales bacterium]|nr:MAG: 2-oxoglutarate dehydrogenase complex dihydrolipoyllysine-residue succinyltransferase [Phycisphaerales bacterium]